MGREEEEKIKNKNKRLRQSYYNKIIVKEARHAQSLSTCKDGGYRKKHCHLPYSKDYPHKR